MYRIIRETNRIEEIEKLTFKDLGFREREHLQEWIANKPDCLGEELLVIQKEFAGFSDTRERLDLLALDKQGSLVIIENKLDDTGRDVTWQALKYASYCSSLTREETINIYQDFLDQQGNGEKAEEKLEEFFETEDFRDTLNIGYSQRLILISGEFRKEVTSTVLWLLNYGLRVQCYKVTPYKIQDQLLLNVEQIIPLQEAEEYAISMARKSQEEISTQKEQKNRHQLRREFWTQLIHAMNSTSSSILENISPTQNVWIGSSAGLRGFTFSFVITRASSRAELYIDPGEQEENKRIFDMLLQKKNNIEKDFGGPLIWQRLDEKRASRIKCEITGVNAYIKDDWDQIIAFLTDGMNRLEKALKGPVKKAVQALKAKK